MALWARKYLSIYTPKVSFDPTNCQMFGPNSAHKVLLGQVNLHRMEGKLHTQVVPQNMGSAVLIQDLTGQLIARPMSQSTHDSKPPQLHFWYLVRQWNQQTYHNLPSNTSNENIHNMRNRWLWKSNIENKVLREPMKKNSWPNDLIRV